MAKFLAMRIVGGHMTYSQVPASLKEQVKTELTAMGRKDLIVEQTLDGLIFLERGVKNE